MNINDTGLPLDSLHRLQVSAYVHVASAALLVLDWFLLLDDEVKYAWSSSWNLGTYLFFLTRYGAFVDAGLGLYQYLGSSLSQRTCYHLFEATGTTIVFGMAIAEVTLTLRVWAIWGKNSKVGGLLFASFLSCTVAATSLFIVSLKGYQGVDNFSTVVTGCFMVNTSKTLSWCLGALMIHQTLIFFMTLVKSAQLHVSGMSSIICMFYLEGVMYYVILQILSVVNVTFVIVGLGVEFMALILSIQRVLQSVLCVRMLLHIRQVGQNYTTDSWTPVPSATSLFDLPS